jgi:hypothetical protein
VHTPPLFACNCAICHKPVCLETSKTDECGQPVHEEFYVENMAENRHMTGAEGTTTTARAARWRTQ